ncbi:Nardilysin [Ooceraea biroi]|uniref:Nardilysin n=1 Tax=Ooceraea biroi TaxID=2015173 RepID=A0A026WU05_OOCBI|nr:Nardilysin [Ooceraea biroi]
MPKRPTQSAPDRKAIQNPAAGTPVGSYPTGGTNLNPSRVEMVETERAASDDDRRRVEYLETPVKSENDKKEYRVIRLQNGLTALLVSDIYSKTSASQDEDDEDETSEDETEGESEEYDDEEDDDDDDEDVDEDDMDSASDDEVGVSTKHVKREEKKAACGLSIGVGSFSDPPEIPGMAHFLEHMVFMGSEKYPQENELDSFLSKHGGFSNAMTDCEITTFYFDVQEKYLFPALDRFTQFFIKPLMKKDAISREREAVESEFQLAVPDDENRKEQLFSTFARAGHPAGKFVWGNLVTLRDNVDDDVLYAELHKFRERHYSANRMTLTIQARLSLDKLEEYVTTCFTDIPNNGLPPTDFTEFKDAVSFDTPAFRRMYNIKPVKDYGQLELTWAMPSLLDFYKSKPHDYVSWILGHEGKGSLISYLRKNMWAVDILCGSNENDFEHNSMYALMKLTVMLTDKGQEHLSEVLDAIFSFINLMRREGPQKRIYDEICQIEETDFRFSEDEDPVDYVERLCENMHFYPPRDYIIGESLYFEYNPELIRCCMDRLVPEHVNIIVLNNKFTDKELHKVEPWFNTHYDDLEVPRKAIERWKTIEPLPEFHLSLPNEFLTSDFSLITLPANVAKYPTKVYGNLICEIWYRPDTKFLLPDCFVNFHLISPLVLQSSKNTALMDLYVTILKLLLVEELYPATAANLDYDITASEKGITVKVNGFNEKLPLLSRTIAEYIRNYSNLVKIDLFELAKEQQLKKYYNSFIRPGKLARDVRLCILKHVHYTYIDTYTVLRDVCFEEFQDFIKDFTDHLYIQCLVQGNTTEEAAVENVKKFVEILDCGSLLPDMIPQMRVSQIPSGAHYCKLRNLNKTDANSVVVNYYQAGVESIELSVLIDLLMLLMEEPLFNKLRTQEQLGYDISCSLRNIYGVLGCCITIYIQANKYTTEHVDRRIEEFLKFFMKTLEETSEEDFNNAKDSLTKLKQCVDIDLQEEFDRNWNEITKWQYMFDRIEREVVAIQNITMNEVKDWVMKYTPNGGNYRKLSVHVVGTAPNENKDMKNEEKTNDLNNIEVSGKFIEDIIDVVFFPPSSHLFSFSILLIL